MAALRALTYSPFIEVDSKGSPEDESTARVVQCGPASRLVAVVGAEGHDDVEVQGDDEDDPHPP